MRYSAWWHFVICSLLLTTTTCPDDLELPPLPSLHEAVLQLKQALATPTLSRQERSATYHELHRLLFLMYLLQADTIEKEARINAHHAFSQLYYLPGIRQQERRMLLSRFVAEICSNGILPGNDTRFITLVAQLEEALCPLTLEHTRGPEVLFAFSRSACAMSVRPRLTKMHKLIWISGIAVGIGFIVTLTRLLNKIVHSEEKLHKALISAQGSHQEVAHVFTQKLQEIGAPSFSQWLLAKVMHRRFKKQHHTAHSIHDEK